MFCVKHEKCVFPFAGKVRKVVIKATRPYVEIMLLTVSSSSMILEKKYHQHTLAICNDKNIITVFYYASALLA